MNITKETAITACRLCGSIDGKQQTVGKYQVCRQENHLHINVKNNSFLIFNNKQHIKYSKNPSYCSKGHEMYRENTTKKCMVSLKKLIYDTEQYKIT